MRIINNIRDAGDAAITIGNFDGVHLGHRHLLEEISLKCKRDGISFCAITFVPHPHEILAPRENYLLNTYLERRELLGELNIDFLYEIEFTRDLSTMDAGAFLDQFVVTPPNSIATFFSGYDFAFGANKAGGHHFLDKYCKEKGINHVLCRPYSLNDDVISSSLIREKISSGDMELAKKYLGREFFITGTVVRGEGRGKEIGFPTINIKYSKKVVIPCAGVYATKLQHKGTFYNAVTNVGDNPTFGSGRKTTIETHVFDFDETIYGDDVLLSFVKKIREEKKFSGVVELQNQISKDVLKAQEFLRL